MVINSVSVKLLNSSGDNCIERERERERERKEGRVAKRVECLWMDSKFKFFWLFSVGNMFCPSTNYICDVLLPHS